MRVRNVCITLGTFALLNLTPWPAQAQYVWPSNDPAYFPAASVASDQPCGGYTTPVSYNTSAYYAAPMSYNTGAYYAAPMSYNTGAYYAAPMTFDNGGAAYAPQAYQQQPTYQSTSGYQSALPMPPAASGSQSASALTVTATDGRFEPGTLNVQQGATVTWVNRGQQVHTVTFGDVGVDSKDIPPGGSFSATFPHAGTYNYDCRYHAKDGMRGTIVVGQSGGAGGSSGTRY